MVVVDEDKSNAARSAANSSNRINSNKQIRKAVKVDVDISKVVPVEDIKGDDEEEIKSCSAHRRCRWNRHATSFAEG